ncbi:MAG: hypothetical protein U9Q98_01360 [Bacteroidota bacterium]|nr:hypothetical protein [Bacteroidota bacterium]
MKHIAFLFVWMLILISAASSQTVVISEENPDRVYEETDWGPNKQHFGYWFVNYGLPVPLMTDNHLKTLSSGHWNAGYAYKIRMFSFMDVAAELSYSNYFYALNKDAREDVIWPGQNWDKIRTKQNGLKASLFFRLYMNPKRGNYFGTYVDLGGFVDYHLSSGWVYKYKDDDYKRMLRVRHDDDFETFNYGPTVALGRDQFSLFVQYNMKDVIAGRSSYPDMPHFIFGLKINMYSAF